MSPTEFSTIFIYQKLIDFVKTYNAIQSMSRAGTPRDNAIMESDWSRFKDTLRIHFRYWEKPI